MQIVKLNIDGNIGESDPIIKAMGIEDNSISSNHIANFLNENQDADVIEVEIRSNGGSVSHGFDIYDQLRNSGKKIITKGYRVNSIASVIFLAGDERYLSKNAEFIIHNPWLSAESLGGIPLTADVLQEISEDVRESEEKLYKFYAKTLKLSDSQRIELKNLMDKDSDIGSEKAIELGFAHGVIDDYKKKYKKSGSKAIYTDLILAKYKSNINNKMDSNFNDKINGLEKSINKLMNFFKKAIKNAVATLEDGTSVYFDGDVLEIGKQVWLDEEMTTPAPDGEHTLNNGEMIMVADGVVIDIKPVIETEEEKIKQEDEMIEDVKEEENVLAKENESLKSEIENLKSNHASEIASFESELSALKSEISSFKNLVVGDNKKKSVEVKNESSASWKKHLNKARENRNNYGK
jgi:ATP-dependent Clp protease protease subunit